MALKQFEEAAKECTAALKIEKCYLKAIIRRARCYTRMKRYEEAITEYDTWLKYINEYRRNPSIPLRDECRFDRPSKVSDSDYKKALNERSQVQKEKLAEDDRLRKAAEEAERRSSNEFNRRQQWQQQYQSRSSWNFEGKSPNRKHFSSSNQYGFDQSSKSDYQRNRFDHSSEYGHRRRNDGNSDTNPSPSSTNVTCHYQVLQVPKTATDIEIKKAYRKLALKYHPDKNQSEEAIDTFRKVKAAYETLSDATLRRNYDFESVRFYY
jgi:tetratricopeptide (TPR) repeat protein